LLSVVGKTYTGILNQRITSYVEQQGILLDEQAGFRKARSTVDQLLILVEIIKQRRPKKTFCAFIDIQKAYDRVWRDGLWYKLYKYGIRGKMWRVLRNIYARVESAIKIGDYRTAFFEVEVGLRQGCLLSPILFALFINDLGMKINQLGKGVKCGNRKVSLLMFADDIVLIADSKEDLEEMLKVTYEYSVKWRFKYNYDKCGVIVFDNDKSIKSLAYGKCEKKCTCGYHWKYGPNLIKEMLVYKYLGVELDKCLSFLDFKTRIMEKARTNMARVWSMGMRTGFLSMKASLNLWESLVRSNLEYACEVWGKEVWKEGEAVQMDMGRRLLRCSSMTTKQAIQGELGLWSLQGRRDFKKLMYWMKLVLMDDNRLAKHVYKVSKNMCTKRKANWASTIRNILGKYELKHLWSDESKVLSLDGHGNHEAKNSKQHVEFFRKFVFGKIQQYEETKWKRGMEKKSKLRIYRQFKKKLCLEKYLLTSGNYLGKMYMSSLRSGTNKLNIETGRWLNQKVEERLCKQCDLGKPETELHFVTECPRYEAVRMSLFSKIAQLTKNKWNLSQLSYEHQWLILINGSGDESEASIFRCFQSAVMKYFALRKEEA
jgi:hypothetical protein